MTDAITTTATNTEQAQAIHRDATVLDMCAFYFQGYSPQIEASGATLLNLTVPETSADYDGAVAAVRAHQRLIDADPARLAGVRRVADITAAKASGRVGVIFGFQNARPVGTDLDAIRALWEMGVRVLQLTYNEPNQFGYGCLVPNDEGITPLGRQAVRAMHDAGIVVDVAHVGERTALGAIDAASKPIVLSHANPRALAPNPRNVTDALIKAVAATGGVVGACGWGPICWRGGPRRPDVTDLADYIDYMVNLVGIDHVGVGTDSPCSGIATATRHAAEINAAYPSVTAGFVRQFGAGVEGRYAVPVWDLPLVTQELHRRGYPADGIKRVLGGNFVRVFAHVWH